MSNRTFTTRTLRVEFTISGEPERDGSITNLRVFFNHIDVTDAFDWSELGDFEQLLQDDIANQDMLEAGHE
jgi:hypothetical protein